MNELRISVPFLLQTPLESMAGHASLESLIEVYVDVDRPESDQV